MAAIKYFQTFLSSLMISQVFVRVVFSCSAPAEGRLFGFSRIKKMIRSPLTTAAMKYLEYKLKIWSLASSPVASYCTKMAGNTRLTPRVTKLIALMIPVATVLCIKGDNYVLVDEPVGSYFSWAVHHQWLAQRYEDGSNQNPVVTVVDETESQKTDRIHDGTDSKTDTESFWVDKTASGEIHNRVDQKWDLYW